MVLLKKGVLKMSKERKCANCNSICNGKEMYQVKDKYYCRDCMSVCDNCGKLELLDNLTTVDVDTSREQRVCYECLSSDDFFYCSSCEEYYTRNYHWGYYQGNHICEYCSEDYRICDICNNVFHNDDMTYSERTEENLCHNCYELKNGRLQELLEDYYYKPTPVFYGESPDNCYLGVELEVDNNKNPDPSKSYNAAKTLIDTYENYLYLKRDGSLSENSGFEIVTFPCSLSFHMHEFGWQDIMRICRENNLLSNDTSNCGLHVHLSRKYFGDTQEIQDLHIAKLLLLVSKFYTTHILKFSRRKPEELRWCGNPDMCFDFLDDEKTIVDKLKRCKDKGRYQAINLENEDTIEFRIFKGSLNINTFLASLQFVVEISRYAKQTPLLDIPTTKWGDIFMSTEYPELKEYLKRKELI